MTADDSLDEGSSKFEVAELECDAATSEAGLGGISYEELGGPWASLFEPDVSDEEVEHVVGIEAFLRPGGGWRGAEGPVLRAIAIGRKHRPYGHFSEAALGQYGI